MARGKVGALIVALLWLASATGANGDPVAQLDDAMIGVAIAEACDPEFDWDRLQGADDVGQRAYEKILGDLRAEQPNGANHDAEADRALKRRMEEMLRIGKRLVVTKGCGDPEIQGRLMKLEREGLSPP